MERRQEVGVWCLRGGVEEAGNIKEGMGQRIRKEGAQTGAALGTEQGDLRLRR